MSSRTTITSSTLLLKTPTVRTTSQKSSLSMDLGEFWGLPCAMCTVQWSVHESATALPIFHWKLSNIVKTAKNISTIIIISSFAWFNKELTFSLSLVVIFTSIILITPPRHEVLPIAMGARPEDYERQAPYKSYIHVDHFAGDQTNTNIEMEHA